MSAALFWKKRISLVLSGVVSTLLVCVFVVYAYFLTGIKTITLEKSFYFLVSKSTHVQASAQEIVQSGGAGYLLLQGERQYVAYSVYLSKTDGLKVQANVSSLGESVALVEKRAEKLYLKSAAQRANIEKIQGAFNSLYGLLEVLDDEIARLSSGGTQESSKTVLEVLKKQFSFLGAAYKKVFPAFSKVCEKATEDLFVILSDVIFARDLRYLQCELCDSYVQLTAAFSL